MQPSFLGHPTPHPRPQIHAEHVHALNLETLTFNSAACLAMLRELQSFLEHYYTKVRRTPMTLTLRIFGLGEAAVQDAFAENMVKNCELLLRMAWTVKFNPCFTTRLPPSSDGSQAGRMARLIVFQANDHVLKLP